MSNGDGDDDAEGGECQSHTDIWTQRINYSA